MPKTISIRVRLTREELNALEELSVHELGKINISRIVRKSVRDLIGYGPDLIDKQMLDFRVAARNLTGISRNLNQITKAINASPNNLSNITSNKIDNLNKTVLSVRQEIAGIVQHTKERKGGKYG